MQNERAHLCDVHIVRPRNAGTRFYLSSCSHFWLATVQEVLQAD